MGNNISLSQNKPETSLLAKRIPCGDYSIYKPSSLTIASSGLSVRGDTRFPDIIRA
jgi:hypothetical protein